MYDRPVMKRFARICGVALLLSLSALAVAYVAAGRRPGPAVDIVQPAGPIGARGQLEVVVDTPNGRLSTLDIELVQSGRSIPVFSLAAAPPGALRQESATRLRVTRGIGKGDLPGLAPGRAAVVVRAARPVLFGLRQAVTAATREVDVRLEPPRLAVQSTHHYVNHGGAELVVYRVEPPEATSGVLVGDVEYPGFPAAAMRVDGVTVTDPTLKVAFFALLYDQDLDTPIHVFARDAAGNTARVALDHRVFPKPFARTRIDLDDAFLARVVPEILAHAPDLAPAGDGLLAGYLAINGELRRRNAEQIAQLAAQTAPEMLWRGAFLPHGRAQVESRFADHRTYFYKGAEVDQQVHLGFDLAVTANVPVRAANAGRVVFAGYLGIYGQTIVIDHGLGVQSLYAHLSSLEVAPGAPVERGQVIGRSGRTGLAGGDHLHFTMLVGGRMVSPVEWWDAHWIEDRIVRKLKAAAGFAGAGSE